MPRVLIGSIAVRRVTISFAALLVNVTARMLCGLTAPVLISQAMRVVNTRVLPLPAPARISAEWCGRVTASRCSGLSPLSMSIKNGEADLPSASPSFLPKTLLLLVLDHLVHD